MEKHYTRSEIDLIHESMDDKLDKILVQTTAHNGRMSKLERWQAYMSGGMTVLVIIVVPILAWALWVLVNIQGQVHNAVDDALSAYNITQ